MNDNKHEKNPCLNCDCNDPDMGCTMPSIDRRYACSLEFQRVEFFIPMANVPTTTQQMHKAKVVNGKPVFYEPAEVKAVRTKLSDAVGPHRPARPLEGAVRLLVKWCFPICGKHQDGEYRTSKPDTDNLQKMLKDVMTVNGFWKDDAQVASEICEKFWAEMPGLYIVAEELI